MHTRALVLVRSIISVAQLLALPVMVLRLDTTRVLPIAALACSVSGKPLTLVCLILLACVAPTPPYVIVGR